MKLEFQLLPFYEKQKKKQWLIKLTILAWKKNHEKKSNIYFSLLFPLCLLDDVVCL
jgi:hypothetical protein